MQQTVNINGFETVIEIPDGQVLSPLTYSGSKETYRIEYGNGLVEVGGIANIAFNNQTEATAQVVIPFTTLLDAQATALDVVGDYNEAVHIQLADKHITIYGKASPALTGQLKVKWSAKGVI